MKTQFLLAFVLLNALISSVLTQGEAPTPESVLASLPGTADTGSPESATPKGSFMAMSVRPIGPEKPYYPKCCTAKRPALFDDFSFNGPLANVDYFYTSFAPPSVGYYWIGPSGSSGVNPWNYFRCPADGNHLFVNGFTSHTPAWGKIYSRTVSLARGSYKICFDIRSLPVPTFNSPIFVYAVIGTNPVFLTVSYTGNTGIGCNWVSVTSFTAQALSGTNTLELWIYNGWWNDGNDIAVDNIRLVRIDSPPTPIGTFSNVLLPGGGYTLNVQVTNFDSDCLYDWSLKTGNGPYDPKAYSVGNSYSFSPLNFGSSYVVAATIRCPCYTDAYFQLTLNWSRPQEAIRTSISTLAFNANTNSD